MPERSQIRIIGDKEDFCQFVKWSLESTASFERLVSIGRSSGILLPNVTRLRPGQLMKEPGAFISCP